MFGGSCGLYNSGLLFTGIRTISPQHLVDDNIDNYPYKSNIKWIFYIRKEPYQRAYRAMFEYLLGSKAKECLSFIKGRCHTIDYRNAGSINHEKYFPYCYCAFNDGDLLIRPEPHKI